MDEKVVGVLGILACSLPFVLLLFWPFLDRCGHRHPRKRPIAFSIGLVGLLGAFVLGYLGHIGETEQTFFGNRYPIDHYGVPHHVVH